MTTTFNFRIDAKLWSAAKEGCGAGSAVSGRADHSPALRALPQGRHPQMKGSKVMAEDYAQVVDVLHDAALAIDASDDLIINALLNVAVEAAFGV